MQSRLQFVQKQFSKKNKKNVQWLHLFKEFGEMFNIEQQIGKVTIF